MVDYYTELDQGNNAHNRFFTTHFANGSVADTQTTIISGLNALNYDRASMVVSYDGGQAGSVSLNVWVSNQSGAPTGDFAPTTDITGGNGWAILGSEVFVLSGTTANGNNILSNSATFSVTPIRYVAVTGSADTAISGGLTVDFTLKSERYLQSSGSNLPPL